MSPEQLEERFLAEIDRRGADDRYIDGHEELELLQIGVQHGFAADRARAFLTEACRKRGYVVEAAVRQLVRDRLRAAGGRIDRAAFAAAVADAKRAVGGTARTEADVTRLVVTEVEDAGAGRVKTGWFGNWYARVRRRLGMP